MRPYLQLEILGGKLGHRAIVSNTSEYCSLAGTVPAKCMWGKMLSGYQNYPTLSCYKGYRYRHQNAVDYPRQTLHYLSPIPGNIYIILSYFL